MKITKLKIIIAASVLVVIGLIIYYFIQNSIVAVNRVKVENRTIKRTIAASGSVKSDSTANLAFVSGGKIEKIYVKKGEAIKKNQVLAVLDNSASKQSIQSATDARDIQLKEKELFIKQYFNVNDFKDVGGREEYKIKLNKLDELISQSEANLNLAKLAITNNKIVSPIDGTVIAIDKKDGEIATPAVGFITVTDFNNLYFEANLDQEDFGLVKLNQEAEIKLDSYDRNVFKSVVYELPNYAEVSGANKDLFTIKLKITDTNNLSVLLGMTGDADISVDSSNVAVRSVKFDEIYKESNSDKYYVWTSQNGVLKKVSVEIGLEGDEYTEIVSNIDNYTLVVPQNNKVLLVEGMKVKIVNK